jgi:hypothetical protein
MVNPPELSLVRAAALASAKPLPGVVGARPGAGGLGAPDRVPDDQVLRGVDPIWGSAPTGRIY